MIDFIATIEAVEGGFLWVETGQKFKTKRGARGAIQNEANRLALTCDGIVCTKIVEK